MILSDYVERWVCGSCGAKSHPVKTGKAPKDWLQVEGRRNGLKATIRACCISCASRALGKALGEGPWSHQDHRTNLEDRRWFARQEREKWEIRRQRIAADMIRMAPADRDQTMTPIQINRLQAPE